MAAALSAAGSLLIMLSRRRGQLTLFMRNCYFDVRYYDSFNSFNLQVINILRQVLLGGHSGGIPRHLDRRWGCYGLQLRPAASLVGPPLGRPTSCGAQVPRCLRCPRRRESSIVETGTADGTPVVRAIVIYSYIIVNSIPMVRL